MKKLILIRHGDYVGGRLTEYGKMQIRQLAPSLVDHIEGNLLIVSSPLMRASGSAGILAEYFAVPMTEHEVWASDSDSCDNEAAYRFVESTAGEVDTLMVVTHLPFLQKFIPYLGNKMLGCKFPYSGVDKGEGQVIDLEKKTMTRVAP
jgi:phosphohistidine phosphatase SixA